MRRSIPKKARYTAVLAVGALVAVACGGGDDGEPGAAGTDGAEAGTTGGEFSVYICEPESLIPSNTNEVCGAEVLNALFVPLVQYDPETTEPLWGDDSADAHAAEITSEDQTVWTITLKDGFTWQNGDPVVAQDYVNAWNFGSFAPNAQGNSYFFENIRGYDALQSEEEGQTPGAQEMEGLRAVDDQTIEVTLTAPFSQFPLTLGYTAFYALPEVAFDDIEAYEQAPIGNGPFQMEGQWEHNQEVRVTRYDDYAGNAAKADAVTFAIFADVNTGFNDLLAGNLDVMDTLPPERVEEAKDAFGDRFIEGDSSSFTYIGFPIYQQPFDNPDLRKAFSMAIDRQAIIDAVFNGTFTPANGVVSPVVAGFEEGPGPCGEFCQLDVEQAKQLFEQSGVQLDSMVMWFNSGAGHEVWMEAVSNQLKQNLGIGEITFESLQFAEYLGKLDNEEITGPFRLGWVMDYPSPQNYLEPIFSCNGSSNNFGYCNEEFDSLIEEGNSAADVQGGLDAYAQAHDVLMQDLPAIPMWFGKVQAAHSERVTNVIVDPFTRVNTSQIEVVG